jgi:hypothetical protein
VSIGSFICSTAEYLGDMRQLKVKRKDKNFENIEQFAEILENPEKGQIYATRNL